MAVIRYNTAKMRECANKIGDSKKEFQKQRKKIDGLMDAMERYFTGPIEREYQKKYKDMETELDDLETLMEEYKDLLKKAATKVSAKVKDIKV